jgi:hypothetical protein
VIHFGAASEFVLRQAEGAPPRGDAFPQRHAGGC